MSDIVNSGALIDWGRIETAINLLDGSAYQAARFILESELTIGREAGEVGAVAVCLRYLGSVYAEQGELDDAVAACEEALALVAPESELGIETAEVAGLVLCELGRPREAAVYLRAAIEGYAGAQLHEARAELDEVLGAALAELGQYSDALTLFRRAADDLLADRPHDAGRCLRQAAGMLIRTNAYTESVDTFKMASELAETGSELALDCAYGVSFPLAELGRHVEAMSFLQIAADGFNAHGNLIGAAACDDALASSLASLGRHREAVAAYRRAADSYSAAEEFSSAANSRSLGAAAALEVGDTDLVRTEFTAARAQMLQLGDASAAEIAEMTFILGVAARELGDYRGAESELRSARVSVADDIGAVAECDEQLAILYAESRRPDAAMRSFTAAAAGYRDSARPIDVGDCLARMAALHIDANRIGTGLEILGDAVVAYRRGGEHARAAEYEVMRGFGLGEIGRHAEATAVCAAVRTEYAARGSAVEVAWCDLGIAISRIAIGDIDGVEPILDRARAVFVGVGDGERIAHAEFSLGKLAVARFDVTSASEHFAAAIGAADAVEALELASDSRMAHAGCLTSLGDYRRAVDCAYTARNWFGDGPRFALRSAHCLHTAGLAQLCAGEYSQSEMNLLEARVEFEKLRCATEAGMTDCHLGSLYVETGRLDLAEAAFQRSRSALAAEASMLVIVEGNLGALWARRKDLDAAEAAYRRAARAIRGIGDQSSIEPGTQSRIDANLAAIMVMRGAFAGGAGLIRRIRDDMARQPGLAGLYGALCERNLAIAEAAMGNADAAAAAFAAARARYTECGAVLEVAKTDIAAAGADLLSGAGLREILTRLLPAAIFIDAQRFTFAHAASRIAWAELNAELRMQVFGVVHRLGDRTMMADLIETAVNSGLHAVVGSAPDPTRLLRLLADTCAIAEDVTQPHTRPGQPRAEAAAAFVSTVALPLRPPPLLIMPDGRIALGEFAKCADTTYAPISRPAPLCVLESAP